MIITLEHRFVFICFVVATDVVKHLSPLQTTKAESSTLVVRGCHQDQLDSDL